MIPTASPLPSPSLIHIAYRNPLPPLPPAQALPRYTFYQSKFSWERLGVGVAGMVVTGGFWLGVWEGVSLARHWLR